MVTDDLGCLDSATTTVNDLSTSTITIDTVINESCAGDNDGLITVSLTISPPPGVLSWTGPAGFVDPGGVNTTISSLAAGQYIATLIDGLGCQQQEVIDIVAAQALSLNNLVVDPLCFNENSGSIDIFPSGGSVATDYTYDWDNDGTGDNDDSQNLSALVAGTYIVNVVDDNGCSIQDTFNLANPSELIGSTNASFAACGSNDGFVTVTSSGGTIGVDYTYLWLDQATGLQVGNTDSVANLTAGCYDITVTDDNACFFNAVVCISNPTGPNIALDQIDSVTCFGGSDGSIFVTVTGDNIPFVYDWQNVTPPHPNNLEDLLTYLAGTYSLTVTDTLGCISGQSFTIPEPDPITLLSTISNLNCFNSFDGEIALSITGGTPSYSLNWSGPSGFSSTLDTITGLDTGVYVINGSDANGCLINSESYALTQPDSLTITSISTLSNCNQPTASILATAGGGTVSIDYIYYILNDLGDTISTTSEVNNIAAGTYFIHAYDDNNCSNILSVTIQNATGPTISLDTIVDVQCNGFDNGSIFVSVVGDANPFNFVWDGSVAPDPAHQSSEDFIDWFSGTYSVVVTDTNGCSDSLIGLIIDQPTTLSASIVDNDIICSGDSTGSIDLTVSGGTSPYNFDWSTGGFPISSIEDPLGLGAGIYDLIVTDSNNCIVSAQATINEPDSLLLAGSSINSTCGNANGEVSVSVSGGTIALDYSYSWFDISGGYPGSLVGTTATTNSLSAGAYQVLVSDDNGCSDSLVVSLSDDNGPTLTYVATNILCFGSSNGSIDLSVSGANPFNYNWVGPPTFTNPATEDISSLDAGTYTVIVTDDNGCISTEVIDLDGPSGAIQVNSSITDLSCFNNSSGEININIVGGTSPYQTSWAGPNGFNSSSEDLIGLDSGQYVLDILDFNNCPLNGSTYDITQPDSIIIDTTITAPTCGLADGAISVVVSGGTVSSDYSYNWDDISTPSFNIGFTNSLSNVAAGNYQILITDDNGCLDSLVVAISDLTGPILSATSTNVDCVGDNDGTIDLTIIGAGPFEIDWDNDGVGDNDDNEDLIALSAGTYSVTVQDLSTGCIASLSEDISVANSISLSFTTTDPVCNGDSTGTIDATVAGGTPNFSYDWTLGGFNVSSIEDPSGFIAGTYVLTITDNNGCEFSDSATINHPDALDLNGSTVNSTCGNANGEASVVVNGGTVAIDYSYSWFDIAAGYPGSSIGSGNSLETGLLSGSYQVIVTDDNGCLDSLAIAVSDANGPTISDSITNVLCFGGNNGEIDLTVLGSNPFNFSWTGPTGFVDPGTEDLTSLVAGTYVVIVTDNNLCTSTSTLDVLSPSSAVSVTSAITDLLCNGDDTGEINILITGGTSPYQTNWSGPNGFSSSNEDLINLDTGLYVLDIIDSNGCLLNGSTFNVLQPDSLLISETIILPTCNASDGEISVVVSGGTVFTDYTYTWDDISTPAFGLSSFSTITNIGAGNYELTVVDDNNCSSSEVFSITNVNAPVLSATVTDVDCNGNSTGAIDLTITGSSSYTIDWDTDGVGDNDDTEDLNGLGFGTYSVIINDLSTGCVAALSVDVNQPNVLSITSVASDLTCYQDSSGSIDLSITGGTQPYLFDWDNDGVGDNDDTEDLNTLFVGSYNVIVIDSNLCSQAALFNLVEPTEITLSALLISNSCFNDALGSIDVSPNGGTPAYSYEWSNSAGQVIGFNEDILNLTADVYSLTITDDSSCTKDSSFAILSPNEIYLNVTITDANCAFDDGTATANVVGGTLTGLDYIYDWDNDGVGDNDDANGISLLPSGNYSLIVFDDNGCQADTTISIGITAGPSIQVDSITSTSCYSGNDGAIYTTITGGTLPYNYIWNSGINQQSDDVSSLAAETYFLQLIDAIGCQTFDTIIVSQPTEIVTSFTSINSNCNSCDGSASVAVSGGTSTGNYSYEWSNGSSNNNAIDLCSGVFSVNISDDAGCTVTSYVGISDNGGPLGETINVTNPSCFGLNDGSITVAGTGGVAPYVYYWPHNGSVSSTLNNLSAGMYFVEITDQTGCTRIAEAIVDDPAIISLVSTVIPSNCGASTGSIDVAASGGSGGFTYLWSSSQTNSAINNLTAGIYTITVDDATGCSVNESFLLSNFNNLSINLNTTNNLCYNGNAGGLNAVVNGAVGPVNYLWYDELGSLINTGSANINGLSDGGYILEVEDLVSGCSQLVYSEITSPDSSIISLPNVLPSSCDISCDGEATVVVAGQNLPYTYSWSNGATGSSSSGLCPGPNVVTITDVNNCVIEETIIIDVNEIIDVQSISVDATCGACDGVATLSPSGGSAILNVVWFDGVTGNSHSDLCAGVYGYTVLDGVNGCSYTGSVNVNNAGGPNNETITSTDVTCHGGSNGTVSVIPSGGTPPYNYYWIPGGQTTNVLSNLSAGTYNLEVQDANGCIRVVEVNINEPEAFVTQSVIVDASCGGNNGAIALNTINANAPIAFNWSGPNGFAGNGESINNLSGGNYLATITDANGCVESSYFSVNEITADNISLIVTNPLCFESCDGTLAVSPANANYTYSWTNGGVNSSISNLCDGLYGVAVVNNLTGCTSSTFTTIHSPDSISLSIPFATLASCNSVCDAEASVIPSGGTLQYSFSWSPSSGFTSSVQNLCAGSQFVTVTDLNNCTSTQEVVIEQPDDLTINIDYLADAYCVNNADGEINISVVGGDGNYTFAWSTLPASGFSSSAEDINNLLPTNYILSIIDGNNCSFSDTILVDTSNVLIADAGIDSALCLNTCITLTGIATGTSSFSLVWLDSLGNIVSNADTLEICSSTINTSYYILQATDQNCISIDTVSISTNPLPIVDAGNDISEIYGEFVTLGGSPTAPVGSSVNWNPPVNFISIDDTSAYNPTIEILTLQDYEVVVIDVNGCISSDSILVTPIPEIYYPTGFSPNGDGVNELWQIDRIDEYPDCVVEIYNRWGELLFISNGYVEKWDGNYNEKPLPVGTYYYIISLNDPKFPNPYTGPVTIMR